MKKFGFTIGEVLIALGLLGVVSALTVPTLVGENQKKVYASSLAVAVSNFETATRSMIQAEDVPDLHSTRAWRGINSTLSNSSNANTIRRFMADLSEYIALTDCSLSTAAFYNGATIRDINRNVIGTGNWVMTRKVVFQSNTGVAYMIEASDQSGNRKTEAQALQNNINLQERVATVVIDINGTANPNTIGKDIFYFMLGSDGVLYPFGSRDVSYMVQNNLSSVWSSDNSSYACTDSTKNSFGVGCTARVIESGYKMDY